MRGDRSRIARRALIAASGSAVLALAGCGLPGDSLPPVSPPPAGAYRLGPGDKIAITLFGEKQLSGAFAVNDSGNVALPLMGDVHAAGLTSDQLASAIEERLRSAGLYRDPKVAVEVTKYRPIFILGEVAKPGQYPYQPGMTVLTAVAVAGGFTYRAVTRQFSIVRQEGGKAKEGRAVRQTLLQPGDVVTVYERLF